MPMQFNFNERACIIGGTVFGIIPNIPPDDLFVPIIMAFVGALVSFMASMLFKSIVKFLKNFKR